MVIKMGTQVVMLKISGSAFIRPLNGEGDAGIDFDQELDFRLAAESTGVAYTLNVSESAVQEYHSIVPFRGMFANSDFWNDLPEFMEEYWREINETVETD